MGAKNRIFLFVCVFVSANFLSVAAPARAASDTPQFSRVAEFGAIRMTYADLRKIISSAQEIALTVNRREGASAFHRERLSITDGVGGTITIPDPRDDAAFNAAPPIAYSADYQLDRVDQPISTISIQFLDFRRVVRVDGTSQAAVDAAFSVLESSIRQYETSMSGPTVRSVGAVLLWLCWLLPLAFGDRVGKGVRWILLVVAILGPLALWLFPWTKWLPGACIVKSDASFWDRHGALIGAIGTLLSIPSAVLPALKWLQDKPRDRRGRIR